MSKKFLNQIITTVFVFGLLMLTVSAAQARADLSIKSVELVPTRPAINQSIKIIVTGKYTGDIVKTTSHGVNNIAFFHQDFNQEVNSDTGVSPLPSAQNPMNSGDLFEYLIFGSFTDSGTKSLTFKIDGNDALEESNENNNSYTKSVDVLSVGDLVKVSNDPAVYRIGSDGRKHLFSNEGTFWSYYTGDWKDIKSDGDTVFIQQISQSDFDSIEIGSNVTVKAGKGLVKFPNSNRVYTVFGTANLKLISNDQMGRDFYGNNWTDNIIIIQNSFESDYMRSDGIFYDNDNDGLSNNDETSIYNTNPNDSDSDNDGYRDGLEVMGGYNPNSSNY